MTETETQPKKMRRRAPVVTVVVVLLLAAVLIAGIARKDHVMVCVGSLMIRTGRVNEFYWMRKMVEAGPAGARWVLDASKDGSYDGDVEQISAYILLYADYDLRPCVLPLLSDRDPQVRGYATLVAGRVGDERYLPLLEKLAKDKTPLPSGWFDGTVAERARKALLWIRRRAKEGAPKTDGFQTVIDRLTSKPFTR